MANEMKLFEDKLDDLEEKLEEDRNNDCCDLPSKWKVTKHDRALLFAVCDNGVACLKQLRYSDEYPCMHGLKVTKKKLLRRLEWLVKYFKE